MQTPFEEELEQAIYGKRLLVLMEHDDGFSQVLLDAVQFKKVSDAIIKEVVSRHENNKEVVSLLWGDTRIPIEHFEGMADFYPKEFLDNSVDEV